MEEWISNLESVDLDMDVDEIDFDSEAATEEERQEIVDRLVEEAMEDKIIELENCKTF